MPRNRNFHQNIENTGSRTFNRKMWYLLLEKHFANRKWRKYYKNIIFYMNSVNFGLKPSLMWDFGPQVTSNHLSHFLQDLKQSSLMCDDILVITVEDNTFIANIHYLLESLERAHILIDITRNNKEWALINSNNILVDVIERLKAIPKSPPKGVYNLPLKSEDCLPSIFGLLLGYPLIYYFNSNYQNFPVSLILYKALCRFEFLNISDEFQISSFSIPEVLVNDEVKTAVNKWLHNLKSVNAIMFQALRMEHSNEYVNSLNL